MFLIVFDFMYSDENGSYQYDLLLCTLKYSLISSAVSLYQEDALNIDHNKFFVYIENHAQKQALQYLFESYFDFLSEFTEYVSLKQFEKGLKKCGITVDRKDMISLSFQQLALTYGGFKKSTQKKANKLYVTKISFVAWIIGIIYNVKNVNYRNYTKHYNQYYKWIENDLFDLIMNDKSINPICPLPMTKSNSPHSPHTPLSTHSPHSHNPSPHSHNMTVNDINVNLNNNHRYNKKKRSTKTKHRPKAKTPNGRRKDPLYG